MLEKPPDSDDKAAADAWAAFSDPKLTRADYLAALATTLQKNVCAAYSSGDAIAGMIEQLGNEAKLAGALLDDKKCPGAQDLSQEAKSELRRIRDRVQTPPATAAAGK